MTFPPHSFEAPLILCVEDEEVLRRDIAEELTEAGYRVIEAATGEEALEQCQVVRPDLVLCDICLPEMDGYGVLRALQSEPDGFADVPFLFLSALADRRQVVEGKLLGADDYLTKPIDFDLLLATVHARLRQVSRIRAQTAPDGRMTETQLHTLAQAGGVSIEAGMAGVLDLLSTAIVLVGSGREIRFMNRSARDLADNYPALGLASDRGLTAPGRPAGFPRWLDQMTCMEADNGVANFSLRCEQSSEELKIVSCRLEGTAAGASFALFISPAGRAPNLSPEPLAAMFGFTPAESLIAARLARGEKPAEIADILGIAQTTVAFHLRNIFQKTGVSRQASLVAMLLSSPAGLLCPVEASDGFT
ncbi:MAG: response regulator [Sphingobium sp.]